VHAEATQTFLDLAVECIFFFVLFEVSYAEEGLEDNDTSLSWMDARDKVYVLQNRKYVKSGRIAFTGLLSTSFSNPYRSNHSLDSRATCFLSESFALEGFYTSTSNAPNATYQALIVFPQYPKVRQITAQYGGLIQYIPWYAKINVFNAILHFDWYFAVGAGKVITAVDLNTIKGGPFNYVQDPLNGFFLGTGQWFHVTQNLKFRIDVTGSFYQAAIGGLTGEKAWFSNYNFGAGVGWKF
jgi:outer membrane beta-barrel protein